MKRALVCGAGGFIGGHLVKKLKREGYWVRVVDIEGHEFAETEADELRLRGLREGHNCREAVDLGNGRCGWPSTQGCNCSTLPSTARISIPLSQCGFNSKIWLLPTVRTT